MNARTYFHKRYSEVAAYFNKLHGEILARLYKLPFPARIARISGFYFRHPQIRSAAKIHDFNIEIRRNIHHPNLPVQPFPVEGASLPIDWVGAGIDKNAVRLGSVEKRAEQND